MEVTEPWQNSMPPKRRPREGSSKSLGSYGEAPGWVGGQGGARERPRSGQDKEGHGKQPRIGGLENSGGLGAQGLSLIVCPLALG